MTPPPPSSLWPPNMCHHAFLNSAYSTFTHVRVHRTTPVQLHPPARSSSALSFLLCFLGHALEEGCCAKTNVIHGYLFSVHVGSRLLEHNHLFLGPTSEKRLISSLPTSDSEKCLNGKYGYSRFLGCRRRSCDANIWLCAFVRHLLFVFKKENKYKINPRRQTHVRWKALLCIK